jgi:hypothetical protein
MKRAMRLGGGSMMWTILAGAFAWGQAPLDVQFTNVRSDRFTVFWKTATPVDGRIQVSPTSTGPWVDLFDDRGSNYVGTTHHCSQKKLAPESMTYVQIMSGDLLYLNGVSPWAVKTGKAVSPPVGSDLAHGRVAMADATTPVQGAVVFLQTSDSNGVGSPGASAVVSVLTDAGGWWVYEMVNTLEVTLDTNFKYSTDGTDTFSAKVEGGELGLASLLVGTDGNKPAPVMVLTGQSSSTGGAISSVGPASASVGTGVDGASQLRQGSSGRKRRSRCFILNSQGPRGTQGGGSAFFLLMFALAGMVVKRVSRWSLSK